MSQVPSRFAEISARCADLLQEGQSVLVEMKNGVVQARSSSVGDEPSRLPAELRGRLLIYEKRLTGSGAGFYAWIAGACLLIGLIWNNPGKGLGIDLRGFQSWWIYAGIVLAALAGHTSKLNRAVADRYSSQVGRDLRQAILSAGMTPFEVLSMINKDSDLFNIRQQLAADPAVEQQCG
jgi:hypothetical protein